MTPEDAKKLIGGFATGTLTETERAALYAAALDDQALFDELAGDEGLRELLLDPAAKATLLAALDERPRSWWWLWKPAAVLAMAGVATVAVVMTRRPPAQVELTAKLEAPAAPPVATAPAPAVAAPSRARVQRQAGQQGATAATAPKATLPSAPMADTTATDNVLKAEAREAASAVGGMGPQASPMFARSGSAAQARMMAQASVVVEYAVLRREGDQWVPVGVDGLKIGDTAALRLTPNADGFVFVGDAAPVAVAASDTYTTPALDPGLAEVRVVFSRARELSAPPAAAVQPRNDGSVVAVPAGATVAFRIPLTRK